MKVDHTFFYAYYLMSKIEKKIFNTKIKVDVFYIGLVGERQLHYQ